jgi:hypothetical protein
VCIGLRQFPPAGLLVINSVPLHNPHNPREREREKGVEDCLMQNARGIVPLCLYPLLGCHSHLFPLPSSLCALNQFMLFEHFYLVFQPLCSLASVMASFFFNFFFFYSHMCTMFGSFLPLSPLPPPLLPTLSLSPLTPSLPGRNYFALISNFVEERV